MGELKEIRALDVARIPEGGFFWCTGASQRGYNLWWCVDEHQMSHLLHAYDQISYRYKDTGGGAVSRTACEMWRGARFYTVPEDLWDAIEYARASKMPAHLLMRIAKMPEWANKEKNDG